MKTIFYSKLFLISVSLFILLITLYFGLRFKGFRLKNNVVQLQNEQGIHFGRYGIAYTEIDDPVKLSSSNGFTIEIALKAERIKTYGFNLIMSIHNGEDIDQLIIGQWQSHVIIMNGDDYSNKRKLKRISADIFNKPFEKIILTVTSGDEGTALFINGKFIKRKQGISLKIPAGNKPTLTLGNSVYGNHSWIGNVYGFAIYDYNLPYETIEKYFNTWKKSKRFMPFREDKPYLLINFNQGDKNESTGFSNGMPELNIPMYFPVLKKRMLVSPWEGISLDKGSVIYIVINLLGFIPLGYALCALISNLNQMSQVKVLLITLLACFFISLFIEIIQAWIPSRSSQSLDLILNTTGGFLGACGAKRLGLLVA